MRIVFNSGYSFGYDSAIEMNSTVTMNRQNKRIFQKFKLHLKAKTKHDDDDDEDEEAVKMNTTLIRRVLSIKATKKKKYRKTKRNENDWR